MIGDEHDLCEGQGRRQHGLIVRKCFFEYLFFHGELLEFQKVNTAISVYDLSRINQELIENQSRINRESIKNQSRNNKKSHENKNTRISNHIVTWIECDIFDNTTLISVHIPK